MTRLKLREMLKDTRDPSGATDACRRINSPISYVLHLCDRSTGRKKCELTFRIKLMAKCKYACQRGRCEA